MADEDDFPLDRMIDNHKLIKEVKKRRCLYDKQDNEYTNTSTKQIKWREVAWVVFAKYWNNWSNLMKDKSVEIIIKRWGNLRNCFLRELRKTLSHNGYKLRRQYIYFNDLIFLKDHVEKKEQYEQGLRKLGLDGSGNIKNEDQSDQEGDDEPEEVEEDNAHAYDYEYLEDEEPPDVAQEDVVAEPEVTQSQRNRNRKSYVDSDPLLDKQPKNRRTKLTISSDRNSNSLNGIEIASPSHVNVDPDVNFALSLVPMLRSLSQKDKIDAQIQILSVFKNFNSVSTDSFDHN